MTPDRVPAAAVTFCSVVRGAQVPACRQGTAANAAARSPRAAFARSVCSAHGCGSRHDSIAWKKPSRIGQSPPIRADGPWRAGGRARASRHDPALATSTAKGDSRVAPNFCPRCGAPLVPDAQFCSGCGSRLADLMPSGQAALPAPAATAPARRARPEPVQQLADPVVRRVAFGSVVDDAVPASAPAFAPEQSGRGRLWGTSSRVGASGPDSSHASRMGCRSRLWAGSAREPGGESWRGPPF